MIFTKQEGKISDKICHQGISCFIFLSSLDILDQNMSTQNTVWSSYSLVFYAEITNFVLIFYILFFIIMAIKQIIKATPSVTVETKKVSAEMESCCAKPCAGKHMVKIAFMVLTVLNTVLLISLLANQDKAEALKVGGEENYKMLKQIFTTDGYKKQQAQQIEQALQMFANPEAAKQQAAQAPQQQAAQEAVQAPQQQAAQAPQQQAAQAPQIQR